MSAEWPTPLDPAFALKGRSKVITFPECEVWFCGPKLVVDSRVPLVDFTLREFARPRFIFENASYYVSEKSRSSGQSPVYRYVLTPWPSHDASVTRSVFLNEEYFRALESDRRRGGIESLLFKGLILFYPLLGFLWVRQKRWLRHLGFEAHAISSLSIYAGFMISVLCGVFLGILGVGGRVVFSALLIGALVFLVDVVMRYDRLLAGRDPIPPGFYEWLLRRRDVFE